jgi:hypothetical protein
MKCLRLVCLVSLIIPPIFATAGDGSWENLYSLDETPKPTSSSRHGDDDSDDSDTEVSVTHRNDKIAAIQLSLLDTRVRLEAIFNALNCEQPNIDEAIVALSHYQCLLIAKVPTMLQELQRIKELQDASAQSNGDNEKEDEPKF